MLTSLRRKNRLQAEAIQNSSSLKLVHRYSRNYLYVTRSWKVSYRSRDSLRQVISEGRCVPMECPFGRAYRVLHIHYGDYHFL